MGGHKQSQARVFFCRLRKVNISPPGSTALVAGRHLATTKGDQLELKDKTRRRQNRKNCRKQSLATAKLLLKLPVSDFLVP